MTYELNSVVVVFYFFSNSIVYVKDSKEGQVTFL